MKKIIALLLAVVMVFALVACASTAKTDDTAAETTPAETTETTEPAAEETQAPAEEETPAEPTGDAVGTDIKIGVASGLSGFVLGRSVGLFRRLSGLFVVGFSRGGCVGLFFRLGSGSAGNQSEDHDHGEKQSDDLFHVFVPPKNFCGERRNPAVRNMHSKSG